MPKLENHSYKEWDMWHKIKTYNLLGARPSGHCEWRRWGVRNSPPPDSGVFGFMRFSQVVPNRPINSKSLGIYLANQKKKKHTNNYGNSTSNPKTKLKNHFIKKVRGKHKRQAYNHFIVPCILWNFQGNPLCAYNTSPAWRSGYSKWLTFYLQIH